MSSGLLIALALVQAPAQELGGLPPKRPALDETDILRATPRPPPADRLPAAKRVAAKLLPQGSLVARMDHSIIAAEISLLSELRDRPLVLLSRELGLAIPEEPSNEPPLIRMRLLEILDPNATARSEIARPLIRGLVREFLVILEPGLRDAYASVLALRFTRIQLETFDKFLSTSDGSAFAEVLLNLNSHHWSALRTFRRNSTC